MASGSGLTFNSKAHFLVWFSFAEKGVQNGVDELHSMDSNAEDFTTRDSSPVKKTEGADVHSCCHLVLRGSGY